MNPKALLFLVEGVRDLEVLSECILHKDMGFRKLELKELLENPQVNLRYCDLKRLINYLKRSERGYTILHANLRDASGHIIIVVFECRGKHTLIKLSSKLTQHILLNKKHFECLDIAVLIDLNHDDINNIVDRLVERLSLGEKSFKITMEPVKEGVLYKVLKASLSDPRKRIIGNAYVGVAAVNPNLEHILSKVLGDRLKEDIKRCCSDDACHENLKRELKVGSGLYRVLEAIR